MKSLIKNIVLPALVGVTVTIAVSFVFAYRKMWPSGTEIHVVFHENDGEGWSIVSQHMSGVHQIIYYGFVENEVFQNMQPSRWFNPEVELYLMRRDGVRSGYLTKVSDEVSPVDKLPSWCDLKPLPDWKDIGTTHVCWQAWDARGWPFVAFVSKYELTSPLESFVLSDGQLSIPSIRDDTKSSYSFRFQQMYLPTIIAWQGFVADVVIFAIVYVICICGVPILRQAIRRHHGKCALCGYDLSMLEPSRHPQCPECGWNRPESEQIEKTHS